MDFFSGFKWAVPLAFSDAVSRCRFEEGDILYNSLSAYGNWPEVKDSVTQSFQVRLPARSQGSSAFGGSSVFSSNWLSEIVVDHFNNHKNTSTTPIQSTQGRFYTALWKGDPSILDLSNKSPEIPLLVKDVTKQIGKAQSFAPQLINGQTAFVMARDHSNLASRAKFHKILANLRNTLIEPPTVVTPLQAGFDNHENIAPTVDIVAFISRLKKQELEELVKNAVYAPSKESDRDQFRISAHGAIFQ